MPYEAPEGGLFLWYDSIGAFRRRPYEEVCIKYRAEKGLNLLTQFHRTVGRIRSYS